MKRAITNIDLPGMPGCAFCKAKKRAFFLVNEARDVVICDQCVDELTQRAAETRLTLQVRLDRCN